jgi:hypothetical protein
MAVRARRRKGVTRRLLVLSVCLIVVGCSSESASPGSQSTPASQPGKAAGGGVTIDFRNYPDPPKTGDTTVEAIVRGPDGKPITDATVTTTLSMPAMPAMNMPAMSTDAKMTHQGEGHYRGIGQVSMAGTWNVTVSVSREGKEIGNQRFSLVVK